VGETEWRNFRQTLCAGEFSLGAQKLVKSTLESILPDELAQSAEERNT